MNEAIPILTITVFVMAGLIIYLTIINALDRRQHRKWIDDLLTRLMARDIPEYVHAVQAGGRDPELAAKLDEVMDFYENDRVPV